jgi:aminopeptidase N
MSSYLVGLIVSDFNCINGTAVAGPKGDLPIRVCSRPNIPSEHLEYALDVGIKIIEFYEKLYDIKYPLPKCGMFLLRIIILK